VLAATPLRNKPVLDYALGILELIKETTVVAQSQGRFGEYKLMASLQHMEGCFGQGRVLRHHVLELEVNFQRRSVRRRKHPLNLVS
jgi:hypothetical protein